MLWNSDKTCKALTTLPNKYLTLLFPQVFSLSEAPIKPCLLNWLFMPLPSLLSSLPGSLCWGWGGGILDTNSLSEDYYSTGALHCSWRNNRFGWGAGWDHIYLRSFQMKTSICTYCIAPPNLITFLFCCKSAFPSANLLLKPGWNWWSDTQNFHLGFDIPGSYKPITAAEPQALMNHRAQQGMEGARMGTLGRQWAGNQRSIKIKWSILIWMSCLYSHRFPINEKVNETLSFVWV